MRIPRPPVELPSHLRGPILLLLACAVCSVPVTGCSRGFYRRQADDEVYTLIDRARRGTRWDIPDYTITPNSKSRMFQPGPPDFPPQPPDDPVSHRLMQCVDGKQGWPGWGSYGKTPFVANPFWLCFLPVDDEGQLVLDRCSAVELALLQSPEYQTRLEHLYLSALDVTFQRFRFDWQFYGGNDTFFTADGPDRGGVGGRSSSLLAVDTDARLRKLFATGGELVVQAANSLVWQFAGPDDYTAHTLVDFTFLQPLLRYGGRDVVLENLTDSERALVANIRQMERYRREFYARIVAGRGSITGPGRGGVAIGSLSPGSRGSGVGGIMRLMLDQISIQNQEFNVEGLRGILDLFAALTEAGRVRSLQLEQTRQSLISSQIRLLELKNNYQNNLDSFKIELGLPPQLDIRIDDRMLDPFVLINPRLTGAQDAASTMLEHLRRREEPLAGFGLSSRYRAIRAEATAMLDEVHGDYRRLLDALPARAVQLRALAAREPFRTGQLAQSICDVDLLHERVAAFNRELFQDTKENQGEEETLCVASRIQNILSRLDPLMESDAGIDPQSRETMIDLVSELSDTLFELSLLQARVRVETAMLVPTEIGFEKAIQTARRCRRDWMNARAALVDRWRQIQVVSNELESDLDVTFSGDINTHGNHPFRFRGTTGRLRVGLEFDGAFTRLTERNAYRETLIEYQRARREYYTYEDRVTDSLRVTIRAIELDQLNFELNRVAVQVAISQVDQARLVLTASPRPGQGSDLGPTAARDVVTALTGLLSAQNDFAGVWVDNEVQRMNLNIDMGIAQLDSRGLWIDPGPIRNEGTSDDAEEPPFERIFTPEPETAGAPRP